MDIAMKSEDKQILCSLIRDHEDAVGSSRVTMMAINAFIESIRQVRCRVENIRDLYSELSLAIKDTEPKVIPLIHLIEEFETEMNASTAETTDGIKDDAIRILQEKHRKIKTKVGKVIEHGLTCIAEGDVIIVHTLSFDVTNMLKLASEVLQKAFKVIVLKQDLSKTRRLVKSLSASGIDMEIIPEYSLGHHIEQGNKLFMGALSISEDMRVITASGSANVVSLCHLNSLPIYLFANTLKFSHRPSSQQRIHRKVEATTHGDLSFQLIKHSHDTVDLEHVDFLVTEEGIKDKGQIAAFMNGSKSGGEPSLPG
jgi:translation initiation factor 2B subunit (eIF-2B alpha/beta/delta family)